MEEQIPEAWVGHEVTVYFGQGQQREWGTLVAVTDKGLVVRSKERGVEKVYWYPHSSITRILYGSADPAW
jgi:hypothetical protein